jgi:hypothetical protein
MKLNGPEQIMMTGAYPAPTGAIISLAAIKAVAMRALAHLIIWVSREQRVRE